jgi:hypothetical protein
MQEPVYILKNGQSVPYIPVEVKTSRDAYAASLHVLFKHVADFHICVVKTFSVKYGIPEDDILKTIQESDEFKNMKVDPVLDIGMHSLGYLAEEVPVDVAPVDVAPVDVAPVKKTRITKAKKTKNPDPEPVIVISEELRELRPDPEPPALNTIKPKTIRKKIVVPKPNTPIAEPATTPSTTVATPTTTVATTPITTVATIPTTTPTTPTTTVAKQSTTVAKQSTTVAKQSTTVATTPSTTVATTPSTTVATTPSTTVATHALQALALGPEGDVPRKIIKKKTNPMALS